jgi:beta-1,4-mannosyltransferase
VKVLIFPRDGNPYQELLYGAMRKAHPDLQAKYVKRYPLLGSLVYPMLILFRRLQGYKLIHVHWPAFTLAWPMPFRQNLSYHFFKFCVWWTKLLGFKIIWTVHNVLPHEPQTSNDRELMQYFSHNINAKILHSSYTLQQLSDASIDITNYRVIPIGSYENIYKKNYSERQARSNLVYKKDEYLILFFGLVRPYKGVEELIEVIKQLDLPGIRLLIVGMSDDKNLEQYIKDSAQDTRINYINKFVPDNDVAQYFQACDIVCLPFRNITTSSSILLSMAFSKPTIAPRLGALKDLPKNTGYYYDSDGPEALAKTITDTFQHKEKNILIGKKAKQYSERLSWDKISQQTYLFYEDILNNA